MPNPADQAGPAAPLAFASPAFPTLPGGTHGMTLRDYFAAQALPLAAAVFPQGHPHGWRGVAAIAYCLADAMQEARTYIPRAPGDTFGAFLFREAAAAIEAEESGEGA